MLFSRAVLRLARPNLVRSMFASLRWQPCRALSSQTPPASDGSAQPPKEPASAKEEPSSAAQAAPLSGSAGSPDAKGSSLVMSEEDEGAPPPMEWEPGVTGTVQKGLSAIVIAFGAVAFGVCAAGAYMAGAYMAHFPGKSSPGAIFEEAADKVKVDPEVADRLGTPIKSYGADFGGGEGRRNFVQSWEVQGDDGLPAIQIKFNAQGPQGRGVVHAQAPASRSRGQFNFIVFEDKLAEDKRRRDVVYVLDNRTQLQANAFARAEAATAKAFFAAQAVKPAAPAPAA